MVGAARVLGGGASEDRRDSQLLLEDTPLERDVEEQPLNPHVPLSL